MRSFYQDRLGTNIGRALKKGCVFCRCVASAGCASWTLDSSGSCTLASSVPYNRYTPGAHSGVKGQFEVDKFPSGSYKGPVCLTLNRPGTGPAQVQCSRFWAFVPFSHQDCRVIYCQDRLGTNIANETVKQERRFLLSCSLSGRALRVPIVPREPRL